MIKINDYATKNHLNEWEIKELPEGDVYRLDLTDNNFDLLLLAHYEHFEDNHKVFLPNISKQQLLILQTYITGQDELNRQQYGSPQNKTQYYVLCDKTELICDNFHYITPDWSKYIAEGNAVLFLSEEDGKKYSRAMGLNWFYWLNKDSIDDRLNWNLWINKYPIDRHFRTENTFFDFKKEEARLKEYYNLPKESKKILIILPSIHSQNIQEISNIAKDLKENYGVEYVEIVATHCYLSIFYDKTPHVPLYSLQYHLANYECEDDVEYINYIDKIITTESTGVLKVQDTDTFKVIDCEEFFINFLRNDKS